MLRFHMQIESETQDGACDFILKVNKLDLK